MRVCGAHLLAHLQRLAEQLVQDRAGAVLLLGASSHAARTWPWISLSPTTIESRLEATRKSCAAARSSRST